MLTEAQVQGITDLRQPQAQARKLRELGFVVLGFSARGKVRALAEHPSTPRRPEDAVRLNL